MKSAAKLLSAGIFRGLWLQQRHHHAKSWRVGWHGARRRGGRQIASGGVSSGGASGAGHAGSAGMSGLGGAASGGSGKVNGGTATSSTGKRPGVGSTSSKGVGGSSGAGGALAADGGETDAANGPAIYVSPTGDDSNDGSIDHPLQTITAARDMADKLKANNTPVTVYLRAGTYYLTAPVQFGPSNSGAAGAPIAYTATLARSRSSAVASRLARPGRPIRALSRWPPSPPISRSTSSS